MGCGCGGGGTSWSYEYELVQESGASEHFDTLDAARVRQAEIGGVVRTIRIQQPLASA